MTRISTQPASAVPKPDSMLLGELAIAAGLVGKPVALCFTESTAAVDCELWKYLARFADPTRVLHIHRQANLKKLKTGIRFWRVVIVHTERLLHEVSWVVDTHAAETVSCPAILSRVSGDVFEDVPLPTISLRGNEAESVRIVQSLLFPFQPPVLPDEPPTGSEGIDSALIPVVTPCSLPDGKGPTQFEHCRVVEALLSGAAFFRSISQPMSESSTAGRTDYELVRRLLQSPLVDSAQDTIDKLAIDMVNRTNVDVEVKTATEYWENNPLRVQGNDPILKLSGSRTYKELVTRREVADLGNTRSRLVREMLQFLKLLPDGYAKFARMGLVRQPPEERAWPTTEPHRLAAYLRSWSAKQVRTHLDGLQKAGMILGQRDSPNGPWKYELPEELASGSAAFGCLPPASELFHENNLQTGA